MYHHLKNKFSIENNIDYDNTKAEKEKIDLFLLSIDSLNYPYPGAMVDELEKLSNRLEETLLEYDKKRIQSIKNQL